MSLSDFPQGAWKCHDEVDTLVTDGGTYVCLHTNYFRINCTYNKIFPPADLVLYQVMGAGLAEVQRESQQNVALVDNRFSLPIIIQR